MPSLKTLLLREISKDFGILGLSNLELWILYYMIKDFRGVATADDLIEKFEDYNENTIRAKLSSLKGRDI